MKNTKEKENKIFVTAISYQYQCTELKYRHGPRGAFVDGRLLRCDH
jgi:hypothetical protein